MRWLLSLEILTLLWMMGLAFCFAMGLGECAGGHVWEAVDEYLFFGTIAFAPVFRLLDVPKRAEPRAVVVSKAPAMRVVPSRSLRWS